MVLISSLQAEYNVPSCCYPAWNNPWSRGDHKSGCWSQNKEPNTKILASPQGNIRPALPFPSEQERVGSAQLHPTYTHAGSSPRAPSSPDQLLGVAVEQEEGATATTTLGQGIIQLVCSLHCQHGVRSGQVPAFRGIHASQVISCGREGGMEPDLLAELQDLPACLC